MENEGKYFFSSCALEMHVRIYIEVAAAVVAMYRKEEETSKYGK
jgi:hypothetical protein